MAQDGGTRRAHSGRIRCPIENPCATVFATAAAFGRLAEAQSAADSDAAPWGLTPPPSRCIRRRSPPDRGRLPAGNCRRRVAPGPTRPLGRRSPVAPPSPLARPKRAHQGPGSGAIAARVGLSPTPLWYAALAVGPLVPRCRPLGGSPRPLCAAPAAAGARAPPATPGVGGPPSACPHSRAWGPPIRAGSGSLFGRPSLCSGRPRFAWSSPSLGSGRAMRRLASRALRPAFGGPPVAQPGGQPVPPRRPVSGLRSLSGGGCAACGPRPGRRCRPPERGRRLRPAAFVWLL